MKYTLHRILPSEECPGACCKKSPCFPDKAGKCKYLLENYPGRITACSIFFGRPEELTDEEYELMASDLITEDNLQFTIIRDVSTNGEGPGIGFTSSGSEHTSVGAAIIHERRGANSQGALHFATKKSTSVGVSPVIRMTIDDSGFVGIGTQDPTTALHVKGMIFTDGETGVEGIKFPDKTVQTTAAVAGGAAGEFHAVLFAVPNWIAIHS